MYDCNCTYVVNEKPRMKHLVEAHKSLEAMQIIKIDPKRLFPRTVAGIGKFHLAGHRVECRNLFSLNRQRGVARTDGEASERMWPDINLLCDSTREMNPGHAIDTKNRHYDYQNATRVHDTRTCFLSRKVRN